jgi:hypothetical protein
MSRNSLTQHARCLPHSRRKREPSSLNFPGFRASYRQLARNDSDLRQRTYGAAH